MNKKIKSIIYLIIACVPALLFGLTGTIFKYIGSAFLAKYWTILFFLIPLFALISFIYSLLSIKEDKKMIIVSIIDIILIGIFIFGLYLGLRI